MIAYYSSLCILYVYILTEKYNGFRPWDLAQVFMSHWQTGGAGDIRFRKRDLCAWELHGDQDKCTFIPSFKLPPIILPKNYFYLWICISCSKLLDTGGKAMVLEVRHSPLPQPRRLWESHVTSSQLLFAHLQGRERVDFIQGLSSVVIKIIPTHTWV